MRAVLLAPKTEFRTPRQKCCAQVSYSQLTPHMQEWRKKRYGGTDWHTCTRLGTHEVDGKPYCATHAGRIVLEWLVAQTEAAL